MFPNHIAKMISNQARIVRNERSQKIAHFDFTNETDALRIFLICSGELVPGRQRTNSRLLQLANRKASGSDLQLPKQSKEIALIFVLIDSFHDIPGAVGPLNPARVMAGRYCGKAVLAGVLQKNPKFHFTIAHDVGVWRYPGLISIQQVINDSDTIFPLDNNHPEW